MNFISLKDAAQKWNVSEKYIAVLCRNGRVVGAKKIGRRWYVPEERPFDSFLTYPNRKKGS